MNASIQNETVMCDFSSCRTDQWGFCFDAFTGGAGLDTCMESAFCLIMFRWTIQSIERLFTSASRRIESLMFVQTNIVADDLRCNKWLIVRRGVNQMIRWCFAVDISERQQASNRIHHSPFQLTFETESHLRIQSIVRTTGRPLHSSTPAYRHKKNFINFRD